MKRLIPSLVLMTLGASCNSAEPSHVKVTNGKPVAESVVADKGTVLIGNGLYSCTGTFLTPAVLLTAAHCLYVFPGSNAKPSVTLHGGEGPTSIKAFYDQTYFDLEKQGAGLAKMAPYDVAIALFPEGTATRLGITSYRALAASHPKAGDRVRILGYGYNDMVNETGSGTKREGSNEILDLDEELIAIDGTSLPGASTGVDANLGSGDSGGPLLDRDGRVAGVSIAVSVIEHDRHTGFFVNTAGPISRKLFTQAIHCASAPCAGDFLANAGDGPVDDEPPVVDLPPNDTSPNGTCSFKYSFEQTITNGGTVSSMCYPEQIQNGCRAGYRCPRPDGLPRTCPREDKVRDLACQ